MFKDLLIGGKNKNMERPIKGGYILVSLGLIALSTSYSGSIDYDRISKTKKHIILTGIKIATTVMPDIAVKPIYGNGTITFEDVYGFDVVISSNNSVSVSEHVAPSGGTKLYLHKISTNDDELVIVSNESEPYIIDTNFQVSAMEDGVLLINYYCEQTSTRYLLIDAYFEDDNLQLGGSIFNSETGLDSTKSDRFVGAVDTVTEL